MTTTTKNLTIVDDGGIYDISSNEEFKDLLESLQTKYLENVETGRRVLGFLSLADGGSYTTAAIAAVSATSNDDDNMEMVVSTDESSSSSSSSDGQRSQDEEDEMQTQMAISDEDTNPLKKAKTTSTKDETNANKTTTITMKHNAAAASASVPKAIVVRRASIAKTKSRARNSFGQRKQQQFEKSLKKQLDVATALVKAGNLLAKQGKLDGAINTYRRVLKIRLKVLGKHHPNVASAFSNLGSILYVQDECEEATGMYQRALKIKAGIHGNNHPDVAQLCYNLGKALHRQESKQAESRQAYTKALAIYLKISNDGENQGRIETIRKSLGLAAA